MTATLSLLSSHLLQLSHFVPSAPAAAAILGVDVLTVVVVTGVDTFPVVVVTGVDTFPVVVVSGADTISPFLLYQALADAAVNDTKNKTASKMQTVFLTPSNDCFLIHSLPNCCLI
jgi:hypothetical protein